MDTAVSDVHVTELANALAVLLSRGVGKIKEVIGNLLESPSELVKQTSRVDDLDVDDSSAVFIMDHHVTAAAAFFVQYKHFKKRTRAVVFGHKHQGKTQFLFFITKLLQALGEGVVYLDKSIAPKGDKKKADVKAKHFCPYVWQEKLVAFLGEKEGAEAVVTALSTFRDDGLPGDFEMFHDALRDFTRATGARVWLIVDEAASEELKTFRSYMPEEQEPDIFHSIITGSVGIASFVSDRHLEKWTWDLPLFAPLEAAQLATKLLTAKQSDNDVDMWDALGIKKSENNATANQDLGDALEELFGGVAGYTAELVLALVEGETLSAYVLKLSTRVNAIIVKASEKKSISPEALAKFWLDQMRATDNTWSCVRDAGLCGTEAPRGVIFSLMLKWLLIYAPGEDKLMVVKRFRQKFMADAGLDGNLLELQEILQLQAGISMAAVRLCLSSDGKSWEPNDVIQLPSAGGETPQLWTCTHVDKYVMVEKGDEVKGAKWNVVQLPTGFPVIDVLLFQHGTEENTLHFYLVQITRAEDPFRTHFTDETCTTTSKDRIGKVLMAAASAIKFTTNYETSFVMLAPNTIANKHVAPEQKADFYFSPASKLCSSESAPARKKQKTACCKCSSGDCQSCSSCGKAGEKSRHGTIM
jgi:hypothetical protein